jgi:hypothetical protein
MTQRVAKFTGMNNFAGTSMWVKSHPGHGKTVLIATHAVIRGMT